MKVIPLTKRNKELLEKAVRWTISDLQYERRQAEKRGVSSAAYDAEINEYKQLKTLLG